MIIAIITFKTNESRRFWEIYKCKKWTANKKKPTTQNKTKNATKYMTSSCLSTSFYMRRRCMFYCLHVKVQKLSTVWLVNCPSCRIRETDAGSFQWKGGITFYKLIELEMGGLKLNIRYVKILSKSTDFGGCYCFLICL